MEILNGLGLSSTTSTVPDKKVGPNKKTEKVDNNPFLKGYGKLVCTYFSPEKKIGDPISLFPNVRFGEDLSSKKLTIDTGLLEFLQKQVDDLRSRMREEKLVNQKTFLNTQFDQFQKAVDSGEEAFMKRNEFYQIAKRVFQVNIHGMKNSFIQMQQQVIQGLPGVNIASVHQELIKYSELGSWEKLLSKVKKNLNYNRSRIEKFLFAVSVVPSTFGLKEFLLNLNFLSGSRDEEIVRFIIAFVGAMGLTAAVYDCRRRIMESVVEEGDSLQGIISAYKRSPVCMAFLSVLVCGFGKMNYDGLIDLSFKNMKLNYKSRQISDSIGMLGVQSKTLHETPHSLHDLQKIIHREVDLIIKDFQKIPKVEMERDEKKGSRLLNHTSLDLRDSFVEKLNEVASVYITSFRDTESAIQEQLLILNSQEEFNWNRISNLMFSPDKNTENVIDQITQILNNHLQSYTEFLKNTKKLIDDYSYLLQEIDPSIVDGGQISEISSLPVSSIVENMQKKIVNSMSDKETDDLMTFLEKEHGESFRNFIFSVFFLLSLSLNLNNPFYQLKGPSKRGREDQKLFPEMKERISMWENDFVAHVEAFFRQTCIQSIVPGVLHPSKIAIKDIFYVLLEEHVGAKSKDRQNLIEKGNIWFDEIFRIPRSENMKSVYERSLSIQNVIWKNEAAITKMIDYFFPGLGDPVKVTTKSFMSIHEDIKSGQGKNSQEFDVLLNKKETSNSADLQGLYEKVRLLNNKNWDKKNKKIIDFLNNQQTSVAVDIFPTRTTWHTQMISVKESEKESTSLDKRFPDQIKERLLKAFPEMEQQWLIPLEDIYSRFPRYCELLGISNVPKIRNQFDMFQISMLKLLESMTYREGQLSQLELYSDTLITEIETPPDIISFFSNDNTKIGPAECLNKVDKIEITVSGSKRY